MSDVRRVSTPRVPVPRSIEEALDAEWLSAVLAEATGGRTVEAVEVVEQIRTTATKIRVNVRFQNLPAVARSLCIKSMFDIGRSGGGITDVREASFYRDVAPRISTNVPTVLAAAIADDGSHAVLIMNDLVEEGAEFCSALKPFSADEAALSLEQIACLHAGAGLLDEFAWIPYRAATFTDRFTPDLIRNLASDGRAETLRPETFDADRLFQAMHALRARTERQSATLQHGDCHAGNFYRLGSRFGMTDWQLVQRGHWARDVAYHIAAVLPIEVAEREERRLLDHYLDAVARFGGVPAERELAWEEYRAAQIYGLFLWAITRSGGSELIGTFVSRLGAAVERHQTMALLRV